MSVIKLQELINEAVDDAFELLSMKRNAEIEKDAQHNIKNKVTATVGKGSESENSKNEIDGPVRGDDSQNQSQDQLPASDAEQPTKQDEKDIDSNAIIDKFNIIRSGRSMNDNDISSRIQKYVTSMSPQQRSAVFSVLQKIGSIVAINADASRLTKPSDEPSAVQASRLQMLQKRREDSESAEKKISADKAKPDTLTQTSTNVPQQNRVSHEEEDDSFELPVRAGKRTSK